MLTPAIVADAALVAVLILGGFLYVTGSRLRTARTAHRRAGSTTHDPYADGEAADPPDWRSAQRAAVWSYAQRRRRTRRRRPECRVR